MNPDALYSADGLFFRLVEMPFFGFSGDTELLTLSGKSEVLCFILSKLLTRKKIPKKKRINATGRPILIIPLLKALPRPSISSSLTLSESD